ncbi:MAG: aminomethyl-transferring glycine dehydrogenase subunit GcvPB [Acidiplasma aeolicum]|jgi:glycine dehydrogenase subunit 2|nr:MULTISPECIES: aminomethyl-transferring glycine dehydrogenase subunit GcvPB [Acidiplasma]
MNLPEYLVMIKMYRQAHYDEDFLIDYNTGNDYYLNDCNANIPDKLKRNNLRLPDIRSSDVSRHFTKLSEMNYSVDIGTYPLGSCTMKYNPKYNDYIAGIENFTEMHPLDNEKNMQGTLEIMYGLQEYLKKISGMDYVSLQPSAGAHGEFTGILIVRKYFEIKGEIGKRTDIIIPDSAHGTNPASATMAGFNVIEIPSDDNGLIDLHALESVVSDKTAAFMITNPNTLGIFDDNIIKISEILHRHGAMLYYDGANFNAILGITTPGIMGFDIVHFNLHKTFATPHGGGGPGAGPVAVRAYLKDFLPVPVIEKNENYYYMNYNLRHTIGKISSYYGSFSILLRAYSYILKNGDNLKINTQRAVLNANYMANQLSGFYKIPYKKLKKHEFVLSTDGTGKKALDISKYILDFGVHSPTTYFPLIVKEAMMIEPTETATKKDIDFYVSVMKKALDASDDELRAAPLNTSVSRIDEVAAARNLKLKW